MSVMPEVHEQSENVLDEVLKPEEKPVEEPAEEAEDSQEQKPEETKAEESAVKDVPFHKHPRWIRQQQEKEELRQKIEALEEQIKGQQRGSTEEKVAQMPDSFVRLFGSNEEAWREWQNLGLVTKNELEQQIQRMREEEQAETRQYEEAQNNAIKWAEDEFLTLSEETGIDFTEGTARNQVLDIVEKYGLFTKEGFPNIAAANELREKLYPPQTEIVEEKKRLAAKTGTKTNSSTKESDVFTPKKLEEIRKRGGVHYFLN